MNKQFDDEEANRVRPSSYYQLSTEDYENIWLRIKDRSSKWFWSWVVIFFTVFSGMFGIGIFKLYNYGKKSMNEQIVSYVNTPEFKKEVKITFQNQFAMMQDKLKLIDDGLLKLAIYEAAPYKITDSGFILVDSKGTYVIVEYGTGSTLQNIIFKSHFRETPQVIAVFSGVDVLQNNTNRDRPLHIASITTTGFVAMHGNGILPAGINWIAIGK